MTTCGRCGLQNRADLRFCADCGARLDDPAPAAPPAVPRPAAPGPAAPAASRAPQRPPAPAFEFAPPAAAARPRCPHCGTPNDPLGRFCTGCGQAITPG